MLVLARQRDETIMIGDQIEVTVVDIRGDKVRLGINAPKRSRFIAKKFTTPSGARIYRPRKCARRSNQQCAAQSNGDEATQAGADQR